ncbi:MAG: nucleotidyltransferase family protein [Chloroflexota bacterium]
MIGIVAAGGIPSPDHSLYAYTQGMPKAMIEINGRPMVESVVDALLDSQRIKEVIVVGLPQDLGGLLNTLSAPILLPDEGSLVANAAAGLRWVRENRPEVSTVIGCSSDIPHLSGKMVDHLIAACRPYDRILYYTFVSKDQIEERYPGAKRTYVYFSDREMVAPGDIFLSQVKILDTDMALWDKLTGARKYPLQVARIIGFQTLIKFALRRLTLDEAATIGGRLLGSDLPVGIYDSPYAEMAMDGDKPAQIELLRATPLPASSSSSG